MDRVLQRRDTAANWSSANPVLAEGELGIITDTKGYKIGDGSTAWNNLEYPANPTQVVNELGNSETAAISQRSATEDIIGLYLGNPYTEKNYYINLSGIVSSDSTNQLAVSDYLPITRNENIIVRGVALTSGTCCVIAFYDKDKIFLSGITEYNESRTYVVNVHDIPENAFYIRSTYNYNTDYPLISGVNLLSIREEYNYLINNINNQIIPQYVNIDKYLNRENGNLANADSSMHRAVTDYTLIDKNKDIVIFGYESDSAAIGCFYDERKNFIKSIDKTTTSSFADIMITVSSENIPSNAIYLRVTGTTTKNPYVYGVNTNDCINNNIAESISYMKNISGNFFTIKDSFMNRTSGEASSASPSMHRAVTDFLPIDRTSVLEIYGYESDNATICCFYDENYSFISSYKKTTTESYDNLIVKIPIEDIPENAKYIRCSGNYNNNSYVLGTSVLSYLNSKESGAVSSRNPNILLTGASFAYPANGWFENSMQELGYNGVNKAMSGTSIVDLANTLYSGGWEDVNYEDIDILVIMHVHNYNVADTSALKNSVADYEATPFSDSLLFDNSTSSRSDSLYSQAYDYIFKKRSEICYNYITISTSKWYNTKSGKPVVIILCTHWHDARTKFNESIRTLSNTWGYGLCEFDKNIGFCKDKANPATGEQVSVLYCDNGVQDTEIIDGVTYGLHPTRGNGEYIQKKLSNIFTRALLEYQY